MTNGVETMMKRTIIGAAAVAALLCLQVPALAAGKAAEVQEPGVGAGRIGYVDFNRALNEVSDGRKAKQRLKDEFNEKQQKLDRLQDELRSAKDGIDRDRLLLSEDALRKREEEYGRKYGELQQRLEGFKTEIAAKEQNLTQDILSRLRTIVREIGQEEGYTLILEKSQDLVLYAPDGSDLTDRVIAAYDRGRGAKK